MEDLFLIGSNPRFFILDELSAWPPLTPSFIPYLPRDLTVTGKLECYFEDPVFFHEQVARIASFNTDIEECLKPPATDTAVGRFMKNTKEPGYIFVLPARRHGKETFVEWVAERPGFEPGRHVGLTP